MKRILITLAVLAALITGSWLWVHHAYAADKPAVNREALQWEHAALQNANRLNEALIDKNKARMEEIEAIIMPILKAEKEAKEKAAITAKEKAGDKAKK